MSATGSQMSGEQSHVTSNQTEVVDQLKENARLWVTLDDEERKARAVLKEVAQKKKSLNNSIIQGLEVVDEPHISFQRGGVLRPCERLSYTPLNREEIISTIRDEVGDEEKAADDAAVVVALRTYLDCVAGSTTKISANPKGSWV